MLFKRAAKLIKKLIIAEIYLLLHFNVHIMFKFGYTNKFNGPMRALVAIAIGIVMIIYNEQAMNIVVKIIAAFILASGIVSLAVGLKKKNDSTSKLMLFNSAVDVLIAFLLFIFNSFVANLIIYLIGFVLLGFGVFQLIALISANRITRLGFASFIMPIIVTGAGVFLLFNPEFTKSSISLIAGVSLLFYGLSELISSWKMKKAIEEYDIKMAPKQEEEVVPDDFINEVKDVDYEKIDDQQL